MIVCKYTSVKKVKFKIKNQKKLSDVKSDSFFDSNHFQKLLGNKQRLFRHHFIDFFGDIF